MLLLTVTACFLLTDADLEARLAAGDTGVDRGETGELGDTWETEETGDTADSGETGDTADTGDTAETGDTGETGETGDTADTAETGDTVETGDTADVCPDVDLDGYGDEGCGGGDCDDGDAAVNPGVPEVCNGDDDNCDGSVDEGVTTTWYTDDDEDGYGGTRARTDACSAPIGYVNNTLDCDDGDADINPDASDTCDDVDNDCDGDVDDGLRVPTDYASIQDAIDASSDGESVCVAAGTYSESVDLSGKEITLEGAGSGSTIVDAGGADRTLTINDATISPTVRGFTFTGGDGNYGGGGYVGGLSPVLDDLVFDSNGCTAVADCLGTGLYVLGDVTMTDITVSNNEATPAAATADTIYGAGVYFNSASGSVTRMVVTANTGDVSSGTTYGYVIGAGMSLYGSSVAFVDVELTDNVAYNSGVTADYGSFQGAALALSVDSSTFDGLTISGNTTTGAGTSDTVIGGAVAIGGGSPSFTHLWISDNESGTPGTIAGSAMYLSATSASFTNTILARNDATSTLGSALGTICVIGTSTVSFTNTDVVNNSLSGVGSYGGGIYAEGASTTTLLNTTLYGNGLGGTIHAGGAWYAIDTSTSIDATYSDFYGNSTTEFVGLASPVGRDGNLGVDPLYVNVATRRGTDYDLSLGTGSPLINAGDPSILDVDGSVSDLGAYGGPEGSGW